MAHKIFCYYVSVILLPEKDFLGLYSIILFLYTSDFAICKTNISLVGQSSFLNTRVRISGNTLGGHSPQTIIVSYEMH